MKRVLCCLRRFFGRLFRCCCTETTPLTSVLALRSEQTLRKRYRALKHKADKEEARFSLEEQRRQMQSEVEKQMDELQVNFDKRNSEAEAELETKKMAMQEELDWYKRQLEAAAAAATAAASPSAAAQVRHGGGTSSTTRCRAEEMFRSRWMFTATTGRETPARHMTRFGS